MVSKSILLTGAMQLVTVAVAAALVAGFLGRVHPALDSFAHFRAHLAVALGICALALAIARFRWSALATGLLACGALATTLPMLVFRFPTAQAALSTSADYRLLQINLRWNNPEPDRVLSLIERIQPDIVTLEEVSPMWADKLATLSAAYPHQLICNKHNFGSAILSRRPVIDFDPKRCFDYGMQAFATIDFDGRPVDIAALHLAWPWPSAQSRQIDRLAGPIGGLADTAILAGDFNATTWSAAVQRVADAGNLALVGGVGPTWLAYGFPRGLQWAGLPIDHVMTKGDVEPRGAKVLEDVGSDHWPVLLEFSLKSKQPAPLPPDS